MEFPIFQWQGGLFPFPIFTFFQYGWNLLAPDLEGDFSIGFLHEGGGVWNYTTLLGNLCRARKKIYLPFTLSWPTVFQLTLPSFLHLHSSWFCKMFYTVHQKGRIVPANLCCEGEVRSRHRGIWTQSGHSILQLSFCVHKSWKKILSYFYFLRFFPFRQIYSYSGHILV